MASRKKLRKPGPYLIQMELVRDRIPDPKRFPYTLPAVRHLSTLKFHPKVTFLVGENGSGKSTLLEALAIDCGLNPEGGSRNFNFATRESHSSLNECLRVSKVLGGLPSDSYFLRAESYFNVATEIERLDKEPGFPRIIDSYGSQSLHEQSHGESFFALFRERFGANGLYLMDEPEAALSPQRQIQFLAYLHNYICQGCQFIIATHSPIIMAYPDACIYLLNNDGIREVAYTDTEHYQSTLSFLRNPQRMLKAIMTENPAEVTE
jgi:predicted ATPase